jgi:hypothetical protein
MRFVLLDVSRALQFYARSCRPRRGKIVRCDIASLPYGCVCGLQRLLDGRVGNVYWRMVAYTVHERGGVLQCSSNHDVTVSCYVTFPAIREGILQFSLTVSPLFVDACAI